MFGKKKVIFKVALTPSAKRTYNSLSSKTKRLVDSMIDTISAAPLTGTLDKASGGRDYAFGHIVINYSVLMDRKHISIVKIVVAA